MHIIKRNGPDAFGIAIGHQKIDKLVTVVTFVTFRA